MAYYINIKESNGNNYLKNENEWNPLTAPPITFTDLNSNEKTDLEIPAEQSPEFP